MKRIGRDATLDEAAVRNAEQHADEWRRPVARGPRVAATPITTVTVHPQVWAAAKATLKPGQRLVIVNETCVRIVNQ
jgi:CO dehydrogenase/acetyl-CoA synthase gamma subunit (corrinoid Fe-S protein)